MSQHARSLGAHTHSFSALREEGRKIFLPFYAAGRTRLMHMCKEQEVAAGRRLCNKEPPTDHYTQPPSPPRASTRARQAQANKSNHLPSAFFAHTGQKKEKCAFRKRMWRGGQKHMRKGQEVAASATTNHSRTTTHHLDSVGQSTRRAQSRGAQTSNHVVLLFFWCVTSLEMVIKFRLSLRFSKTQNGRLFGR